MADKQKYDYPLPEEDYVPLEVGALDGWETKTYTPEEEAEIMEMVKEIEKWQKERGIPCSKKDFMEKNTPTK